MSDADNEIANRFTATLVNNAANRDFNRLSVMAGMINVFNYAIQVQANRNEWDETDAQSFAVALGAIDSIGRKAQEERPKAVVENELESNIARLAKTPIQRNQL